MRGTYRCTNVKFCMEDENQRRAWEYLHELNRRDGSYGKVLADALIAVIDSRSNSQNAMRKRFLGKKCENSEDETGNDKAAQKTRYEPIGKRGIDYEFDL